MWKILSTTSEIFCRIFIQANNCRSTCKNILHIGNLHIQRGLHSCLFPSLLHNITCTVSGNRDCLLLLVQLLAAAEHSVMTSHHQHDEKNDTRTPATITVEETSATGTTAAMDMVRCVIAVVVAAKRD